MNSQPTTTTKKSPLTSTIYFNALLLFLHSYFLSFEKKKKKTLFTLSEHTHLHTYSTLTHTTATDIISPPHPKTDPVRPLFHRFPLRPRPATPLPLEYTPTTQSNTSENSIAMNHSGALSQRDPSGTSQDEHMDAAASFAHSLSVAPLDSTSTIHSISLALNGSNYTNGGEGQHDQQHDTDVLMMDATTPTITTSTSASSVSTSAFHFQQPESRMAVAELLVSLGQSSRSVE